MLARTLATFDCVRDAESADVTDTMGDSNCSGPEMRLDLGVCGVRSFRATDAEELARHANNRRVWLQLRDRFPHPYAIDDARRFIATTALAGFTRFAFPAYDLERLYAVPFASNTASCRVLQKVGFQLEGRMRRSAIKDGKVLDQLLYAILRETVSRSSRL